MSDSADNACFACIGCGICTFICYAIGVSIGWVFSKVTVPDNGLALAGAIVITLPVFMVLAATLIEGYCGKKGCEGNCIGCAALTGGCLSGIFDLVGVGLFIGAMVKAASELDSPAGAITCGVFASIFVLAAAITNFATLVSLTCAERLEKKKKSEDTKKKSGDTSI